MNAPEFETTLDRDGYAERVTKTLPPGHATQPHAHEFDVQALVLDGEIVLTVAGEATRYAAGQIFTMARGREHSEMVGPLGVTTLAGRRHAA